MSRAIAAHLGHTWEEILLGREDGPDGEDGEDGFVLALLEAPEADGPTVTVLVTVGVAEMSPPPL